MSTFIPPTPAANKSAEQHEEPSEQDSFNHLLYKVLRLTSEQVQDLNDWMKHRGIPNVHEIIAQNFRKPHALEDDLQFIRAGKRQTMSTFIPPTPAATKSAEQHEEPSEQDSFDHILFKVLRLTSAQVQDLND